MEPSHALSDAILTLSGAFVFFKYIRPLPQLPRVLWSGFILAVTAAAFFGTLRFLGLSPARAVSEIFQHFASTAGAICLVLVTYTGVLQQGLPRVWLLCLLGLGLLLFLGTEISQNGAIAIPQTTAMLAIPVVLMMGIWRWIKGQKPGSGGLILGVLLLVAATFSKGIAAQLGWDAIDLYHYLLAASVFCLGWQCSGGNGA